MPILYVTGKRFKQIITAGADRVIKNRDYLNKINVFPVPDGDTGSNMSATLVSAVREMEVLNDFSLEAVAKAAAWGGLMGARGNSGIIMAQILSGLAESVKGRDRLTADDLADAFTWAAGKARKAILHPKEGTILTVIRDAAEAAQEIVKTGKDLVTLINKMTDASKSSVERTPELLPKLKEAGVVDAGGLGFVLFLEGISRLVQGVVENEDTTKDDAIQAGILGETAEHHWNFRYCTEFVLKGSRISEDAIKNALAPMGDSLVVVGDTHLARVHIHTNQPEAVLEYTSKLGQVSSIKVDDMLVQHTARFQDSNTAKGASVIAIALGDGLKELFYNAGAELVVDGGPTQNPSTSDLVAALETVVSSNVIILPNHKNIYPVALQAREMTPKNVTVLNTTSAVEGLSAMLAYIDEAALAENVTRMEEACRHVKTGEVSLASRSVVQDGVEVLSGDSIGIFNGKIRVSRPQAEDAVIGLVAAMAEPSDEIITLYYGESIEKQKAEKLQSILKSQHDGVEIELYYGGQPYASYIISAE